MYKLTLVILIILTSSTLRANDFLEQRVYSYMKITDSKTDARLSIKFLYSTNDIINVRNSWGDI
jgi:hypothetical protein